MPQNTLGQREHFIRTLDLEIAGRGERSRPVDQNLIAAIERVGDYRSPLFFLVKNEGDNPFTFQIEGSADPLTEPFANAAGAVTFTGDPADGDTVTLDDGTDTVTFEFDDDNVVTSGNVRVAISSGNARADMDRHQTMQNFIAAVQAYGRVKASARGTIELTGNPADTNEVTIDDGHGTVLTFEFDTPDGITGDVAVVIGADASESINNLLSAINASALTITATKRAGADILDLVDAFGGAAGNQAITKTGANITVAGMLGGVDNGDRLRLDAEEATAYHGSTPVPNPVANITHTVAGTGGNNAIAKSGANIVVVGMANGKAPLSFEEFVTPGGSTVTSVVVNPRAFVQVVVTAATARYLRLVALPENFDGQLPEGTSRPQGHVSIAHWVGKLEEYERSNLTQLPQLA